MELAKAHTCTGYVQPTNRLARNSHEGHAMAVFTSGGDAQGMNAALRAIVRMAVYLGCDVYLIHEGYQGMVDGGDNIKKANWVTASGLIQTGGTAIGSARCLEFKERSGRLKAAANLMAHGISNLIAIGGDGTLTGINIFRTEWPDLLGELLKEGKFCQALFERHKVLNVVGMTASIDNDFWGTDMTIGVNSALHRIVESIDAIHSTASSHQRTFVIEVMGRNCGYLAIVTGIITEADYVFCPESPPPVNWPEILCEKLIQEREAGQRQNYVIVSEGATDLDGKPITSVDVQKVIVDRLHQDTRVTVLGHVQRGGNPSAFDRVLASRMGAAATLAVMEATCECDCTHEPVVIAIMQNRIVRVSMQDCIEKTKAVSAAMKARDFERVLELRGQSFMHNLNTFRLLSNPLARKTLSMSDEKPHGQYRFGVMHIGVSACGMNAAVRSFVRNCIYNHDVALGIYDGIDGLVKGQIKTMGWSDVIGWVNKGGAFLGIQRTLPEGKYDKIAERFKQYSINGLVIIGGFDAYISALQLMVERVSYPEFRIPLLVIPAAIDNNLPGTEFSLGSDTALNEITIIGDRIRAAEEGLKRRTFIIETMGGYCGYLATMGGISSGADVAYIFEEKFTLKDIADDVKHMKAKMEEGVPRGLVLRNENASENFNTDFLRRVYSEQGKGSYTTHMNILGHMQTGGVPTPFDRSYATKMATMSVTWFHEQLEGKCGCKSNDAACLLGLWKGNFSYTPLSELATVTNFEQRIPKSQWWMELRPLLKILAKHPMAYKGSGPKPVDLDCKLN